MPRFSTLSILLVVTMTALVTAQPPSTPVRPAPVFRSGVNLVLVDVVVRDKSGAPFKGLTADDFDLLEDGVRQQILTFAVRRSTAMPCR